MASRHKLLLQARTALSSSNYVEARRRCATLLSADPRDVEAMYLNGRCHAALGNWAEAATQFRRLLTIQPNFLPGMIDLGLALALAGNHRDAYPLLQRASALQSNSAELHFGLGLCLMQGGELAPAADEFLAALACNPRFPDAYNNLGVVRDQLGQLPQAVTCFRQAVSLRPSFATALINLGDALLRLGQPVEAANAFEQASRLRPQDALLHADLGAARLAAHDFPAAVVELERALALDRRLARAASNLGEALLNLDAGDRAAAAFNRALEINGELAEAHLGLGRIAAALGHAAEAQTRLLRAWQLKPRDPNIALAVATALEALGRALESLGRHADAIVALEHALVIRPGHAETIASLASCAFRICEWDLVDKSMADLRCIPLGLDSLHPFLLLAAQIAPAEQSQLLRRRGRLLRHPIEPRTAARPRGDRLRVAYVSPDFREHPVAHALAGVIEQHDRQAITPIAISLAAPGTTEIGSRLRASFGEFIDASAISDLDVATLMKHKGIDVAIDLAGHTLGGRPGIFALRAAPLQVNFLGFPASTGFGFMDYIIADGVVLPPSDEPLYTEQVLRMPDCYLPFDSSRTATLQEVSREEAGLPTNGFVFCAFNTAYKITRDIFDLWMGILREVPGSVLWLRDLGEIASAKLRTSAAAGNIAPNRLIFAPHLPNVHDHIARLRLADIFLDTSPYNAHTSAAEALWAGVPVLTRLGQTFAGRVGASLLTAVGIPELICADSARYRALAVDIAHSPAILQRLKQRLIDSRVTSPLFDTEHYTRELEALLFSAAAAAEDTYKA